jgi:hypothetical protein
MDRAHREFLPFHCPVCGFRSRFVYRKPNELLGLRSIYLCQCCSAEVLPHRYWLTLFVVAFLVFPAATFLVIWLTVWFDVSAGLSIWLAAGGGVIVALVSFEILAGATLSWRPKV